MSSTAYNTYPFVVVSVVDVDAVEIRDSVDVVAAVDVDEGM